MPHLEYFVVAESLAIDAQTNRVSIFNVLEEVYGIAFPLHIPNIAMIASMECRAWRMSNEISLQAVFLSLFRLETPSLRASLSDASIRRNRARALSIPNSGPPGECPRRGAI